MRRLCRLNCFLFHLEASWAFGPSWAPELHRFSGHLVASWALGRSWAPGLHRFSGHRGASWALGFYWPPEPHSFFGPSWGLACSTFLAASSVSNYKVLGNISRKKRLESSSKGIHYQSITMYKWWSEVRIASTRSLPNMTESVHITYAHVKS